MSDLEQSVREAVEELKRCGVSTEDALNGAARAAVILAASVESDGAE